jgi:hypothetical protein
MKSEVMGTQRNLRIELFTVVESGVPVQAAATTGTLSTIAIMPEGFTRGHVSEQANNVYTIVFAEPFGRAPNFTVTAEQSGTGVSFICNKVSSSTTAISWRVENDASTGAAPTGFDVIVIGSESADGVI